MSAKTNNKTKTDKFAEVAQQTGLVLMTAAATLGIIELPEHLNGKVVIPNQPNFAFAGASEEGNSNPLRREREESGPHYVSYSIAQRTPGRTGRR